MNRHQRGLSLNPRRSLPPACDHAGCALRARFNFLKSGQVAEAEAVPASSDAAPDHADALHLMGIVAFTSSNTITRSSGSLVLSAGSET